MNKEDFKKLLDEAFGLRKEYGDKHGINTALRHITDSTERRDLFVAIDKEFKKADAEAAEIKRAVEHDRISTLYEDAKAHEMRIPRDSLPG